MCMFIMSVQEQHIYIYSTLQHLAKRDMGLTFVHGNHSHMQQPIIINVSHHPVTRIAADGNCFFRSMSLVITGSHEFHQELHLPITTHMIQNLFSSLVSSYGSMEQYMEQSWMQSACLGHRSGDNCSSFFVQCICISPCNGEIHVHVSG